MAVGLVLLFFFAPVVRDSFALLPPNVPKFDQLNGRPCPLYPLPVPLSIEDLQPSIDVVVKNISSALNAGTVRARGSVSLGLVIDQKLIWSKGFGYINESGECVCAWSIYGLCVFSTKRCIMHQLSVVTTLTPPPRETKGIMVRVVLVM